jgi:hypothetical protein
VSGFDSAVAVDRDLMGAESVASSNVETIERCLKTPRREHRWEMEAEWWRAELGERAALLMAFGEPSWLSWFIVVAGPYLERSP